MFGLVGHTHNGVDANHKIHNQNVGSQVSGDLGHFVANYPKGFTGHASKRPKASFLAEILDWKEYYSPVLRNIEGFLKSQHSGAIRGFRFAKGADKSVELTWKMDPALEDKWRGVGGFPNTPGFYMLKGIPEGVPERVVRKTELTTLQEIKAAAKLTNKKMTEALEYQGLAGCAEWNFKVLTEGRIPVHKYLEDSTPVGEWGRLCEIGAVEGMRGPLREIKDYWDPTLPATRRTMWSLPVGPNQEHVAATSNIFHFSNDASLQERERLPLVRYKDQSAKNCEVALHPRNLQASGWQQVTPYRMMNMCCITIHLPI